MLSLIFSASPEKNMKRIFRKSPCLPDAPWFTKRNDSVMINAFNALTV
jgi:hypothetical protein